MGQPLIPEFQLLSDYGTLFLSFRQAFLTSSAVKSVNSPIKKLASVYYISLFGKQVDTSELLSFP